jgi:hypothetical protein
MIVVDGHCGVVKEGDRVVSFGHDPLEVPSSSRLRDKTRDPRRLSESLYISNSLHGKYEENAPIRILISLRHPS